VAEEGQPALDERMEKTRQTIEKPAKHGGLEPAAATEDHVDPELLKTVEVFFGHE
jgi:hypothetical protein